MTKIINSIIEDIKTDIKTNTKQKFKTVSLIIRACIRLAKNK
jgi:hypothetical protein